MNREEFLNPELYAQLKSLYLAARYVAEGAIGGFHKSPYIGYNAEFSHHREYMPGDEIKHIDWKRYGKSGKYYIKQYEESTSLNALFIHDLSSSMRIPPQKGFDKATCSRILICAMAWLLLHQRDGIGYMSFSDTMHDFLPLSNRLTQFGQLVNMMEKKPVEGKTSLKTAVENSLPLLKKKCMVVIVSDLLEKENEVFEAIDMLRFYKHEVLAFHLLTHDELNFPFDNFACFQDVETRETLWLEGKAAHKSWMKNLDEYLKEVKLRMAHKDVHYQLFDTSTSMEKALIHFLYRRSRHQ